MNRPPAAALAPMPARDAGGPPRVRPLANLAVFEAAWFACILGVAHGRPRWGTGAVGVAMGGARFVDEAAELVTLVLVWAKLTPLVMALSDRLDGVTDPESARNPHA